MKMIPDFIERYEVKYTVINNKIGWSYLWKTVFIIYLPYEMKAYIVTLRSNGTMVRRYAPTVEPEQLESDIKTAFES